MSNIAQTIVDLVDTGIDLFEVGHEVYKAYRSGDFERAEEILPEETRTSIKRQLAEAKARAKFGPRDSDES